MAEKKMTQVQALELAAGVLNQVIPNLVSEEDQNKSEEALRILSDMIVKRRAPKPRKIDVLTLAFREKLVHVLAEAEGPLTNKEIVEAMQVLLDDGEIDLGANKDGERITKVSSQKVANNLKVLEKDGRVVRIRAEKPTGKDSFTLF